MKYKRIFQKFSLHEIFCLFMSIAYNLYSKCYFVTVWFNLSVKHAVVFEMKT